MSWPSLCASSTVTVSAALFAVTTSLKPSLLTSPAATAWCETPFA